MKRIKLFENFLIKEQNEEKPKFIISENGILKIKGSNKSIKLKMKDSTSKETTDGELVVKTAVDQTEKSDERIFKASVWRISYSEVFRAFKKLGWELKLYADGKPVKSSEEISDLYLYISTPKGYSGVISGRSDLMGKTPGGSRRISGKGKATWGFYNVEDLKKTSKGVVPAYKNLKLERWEESKVAKKDKIVIKDGFDYDSFNLKPDAKEKIEKLKEENIKGVWITTGASQDGDPEEEITKKGKEVKRKEWDKYLVKNRYKTLMKFLKEMGIPSKISKKGKSKDGDLKIYGVFDDNLESSKNRSIIIKPVYK